jgi:hypothetical protein
LSLVTVIRKDAAHQVSVSKLVKAESRLTIDVEEEADARLENAAFATRVAADLPIVAERSMYWDTSGILWSGRSSGLLSNLNAAIVTRE